MEQLTSRSHGSPVVPESVSMGAAALLLLAITTCERWERRACGMLRCGKQCVSHRLSRKVIHTHARAHTRTPRADAVHYTFGTARGVPRGRAQSAQLHSTAQAKRP